MKTDKNAGIKARATLVCHLFQTHMGLFVLWSAAPVLLHVLQPILMPFLTKVIPEIGENPNPVSLPFQLLTVGAAVLVLMAASFWVFSYADASIQKIQYSALYGSLNEFHKLPFLRRKQKPAGETFQILNAGAEGAVVLWISVQRILEKALAILFLLLFTLTISLPAAVLLLLVLGLQAVRMKWMSRSGLQYTEAAQPLKSEMEALTRDFFQHVEDSVVNQVSGRQRAEYQAARERLYQQDSQRMKRESNMDLLFNGLAAALRGLVFPAVSLTEAVGLIQMTGPMVAVYSVFDRLQSQFTEMFFPLPGIRMCGKLLDNLQDYLALASSQDEDAAEGAAKAEFLRLEHLSWEVQGHTILNDVSLSVSKGEKVALAGHNGSGKSTLLKLLAGVYSPTQGLISLDGNRCDKLEQEHCVP